MFERAHGFQNALVSWLRTRKVWHEVKISACVNVHASIYILYIQPVLLNVASEHLKSWGGSLLLKKLFALMFFNFFFILNLKCIPNPLPLPPGTFKSKTKLKDSKWYIWEIWWAIGKSNWPQKNQPAVVVSSLSWRVSLNVCLFLWSHTGLSFLSKFLVKTNMTSLCNTLGQRRNVSRQNE